MLLQTGESVLRSAYAVLDAPRDAAGGRGPGVLYLTNRRLVFESHVSRGIVRDFVGGKEARIRLDVGLHELRNVSVRKGRLGRARLVLELVDGRPTFDVLEPESWASAIAEARRELPPFPRGSEGVVQTIEREVVKIRCRYCGQLGNEVNGRCPTCGAPL
ncbi:MAG: hypothetical protein ACLQD9_02105 [Thermoplasmata archaeon]